MLLKNGIVVTEQDAYRRDVRVDGGLILAVGEGMVPMEGEEVVDCWGRFVLPGGVDVHTHLDCFTHGGRTADDLYTGTVAAAFGGTTTVINHIALNTTGGTIRSQLEHYRRLGDQLSTLDYGLHGVVDHVDDDILEEIEALIGVGVTSFKVYLAGPRKLGGESILRLLERTGELGALTVIHAEDDNIIRHRMDRLLREGQTSPLHHAHSRPVESEVLAIQRVLAYNSVAGGAALYLCNVSSGCSLQWVQYARMRGAAHIYVETCPQYLLLDDSRYRQPEAMKYLTCPPLRDAEDTEALWRGVEDGEIDTIASDHSPFLQGMDRPAGPNSFALSPCGAPGIEERMSLMFHLVGAKGLSLPQMVRLCCAEPARLFGLYPRKGVIAPGSDADLVVIDPAREVTLSSGMLHGQADYTLYEGMRLRGYPLMVMSRGKWIVRDGRFHGGKGRGRFLHRGLPDLSPREKWQPALDN